MDSFQPNFSRLNGISDSDRPGHYPGPRTKQNGAAGNDKVGERYAVAPPPLMSFPAAPSPPPRLRNDVSRAAAGILKVQDFRLGDGVGY